MNNEQPDPIILQTPVAAVVPVRERVRHFDHIIKVFSWMTAAFLAAAVMLALITGSLERKQLQHEVAQQSTELVCRSVAAAAVTDANSIRDNTIAETVIAVANGNDAEVRRLLVVLTRETDKVNDAIAAQESALVACAKH
jgi:hypothetical protein